MSVARQIRCGQAVPSVRALVAAGALSAIATLIISAMPGIVSALIGAGLLDPARAGYVLSVDMAGQVVGVLLFVRYSRRALWSTSLSIGLGLMIGGNLLSCFVPWFPGLLMMRLVAGIGVGMVRSGTFAVFGRARNAALVFSFVGLAQVIAMAAAFVTFPWLTRAVGWFGPYLMLSALGLVLFSTAPWWPRRLRSSATGSSSIAFGRAGTMCLVATFLYFFAQGAVWAFVGPIGTAMGHSSASVNSLLAYVAVPGVAAQLLASVISVTVSVKRALIIGLLLTLVGLYLLTIGTQMWIFATGVNLFYFAWCITVPFEFSAAASSDRSGNTVSTFPVVDSLGFAAGPAIAGITIVAHGSFTLIILAACCSAISVALYVAAIRQDGGPAI